MWRAIGMSVLALSCGCTSIKRDSHIDISPLREFANSYEPAATEATVCPMLPTPPQNVLTVLQEHPVDDEYCRHVTLVLLKLDRFHVEQFHQSYDIRQVRNGKQGIHNGFLSAFARMARITDEWDPDKLDYLGSSIVEHWIDLHVYVVRDDRIKRECERIRTVREKTFSRAWSPRVQQDREQAARTEIVDLEEDAVTTTGPKE